MMESTRRSRARHPSAGLAPPAAAGAGRTGQQPCRACAGNQQLQRLLAATTPGSQAAPGPKCGPDATDWFIRQVNAAKASPAIVLLKAGLSTAKVLARASGFSADRLAEGEVATALLVEEAMVAPPVRTTDARKQMADAAPGLIELALAGGAAMIPILGEAAATAVGAILGAGLAWKKLVGTGKKYDFKNGAPTLGKAASAHCPADCANTITLCPSVTSNCFVKDVPGNLFYAHLGRYVGWSELTLQLGSQFAQLDASANWDPPGDTKLVHFGFGLPDPLTRSNLCSEINTHRSVFDLKLCANCSEQVKAEVV